MSDSEDLIRVQQGNESAVVPMWVYYMGPEWLESYFELAGSNFISARWGSA